MIVLTRLNDAQFAINPDLIERIHENPDTTLVMVDGAKYIVTESLAEVIERIAAYRALVISMARDIPPRGPGRPLELVPDAFPATPAADKASARKTVPQRLRND
ncbi:flagellar FlbD family protein [Arthrobacter yangruifuii]|uniref:flagellar FlbD family protein n=1 Tax=Arthrobacter yangruifuii TaxID=2606616 RepID=UPI0011B46E66|nr:flagellar FlbD family protein [Arthrobacter yangruifuii]